MSTVLVKDTEQKTTKTGKTYWRVNLDGIGWASTFSATIGKLCADHKGEELAVETEKNGDFTNIKSAALIQAAAVPGGPVPQRDALIVRQVALKAAVEYANALRPSVTSTTEDIIANAAAFAAWILGEQDPPEPFDPDQVPV